MNAGWSGQCSCCKQHTVLEYTDRHGDEWCAPCHDGGQCDWTGCERDRAIEMYPELAPTARFPDATLDQDVEAAIRSITGQEPLA